MTTFEIVRTEQRPAAVVRGRRPMAELPEFFGAAFHAVMRATAAQGVAPAGPPFGYYPEMPGAVVSVVAGFPVSRAIVADGEVEPFVLPSCRAVVGVHVGPFDTLEDSYRQLEAWAAEQAVTLAGGPWEEYLSDPEREPDPATWRTRLVWPIDD